MYKVPDVGYARWSHVYLLHFKNPNFEGRKYHKWQKKAHDIFCARHNLSSDWRARDIPQTNQYKQLWEKFLVEEGGVICDSCSSIGCQCATARNRPVGQTTIFDFI